LGKRWETERIAVKLYAAMGGLHAAIDAVLQINAKRPLIPDEIERIDVDLAHAVFHHGGWTATRPLTPVGAQMNVAYAVAVTVLDKAASVQQFSPERINQDDVWSLIPGIVARNDPAFDEEGRMSRGKTRVRVLFRDGQQLEAMLLAGRGIVPPLTNAEVVAKYRALTHDLLDPGRQRAIETFVLGLEKNADIGRLAQLLAQPVKPALGE
jgi:2-methylcitrate dehydratase PrpD